MHSLFFSHVILLVQWWLTECLACYSLLQKREGDWRRNVSRNCFGDRYWERAGQLLDNFSGAPVREARLAEPHESKKIWLWRSLRTPTVRTPSSCKPMLNVRLFWRESVWQPASCEAETTKESVKTKTESGRCFCILLSKVLRLDKLSCPQIWKTEKENVRRQASEAQREKELELDRKNKGDIFCRTNNMKFCSGGEKMRSASGHLGENERQWKKVNKNTYNISSIKH